MNKGIGIVFGVGAAVGYLYRKYGLKPIVKLQWCEDRPRYWTNPYKIYFDDEEKCASAFSDLKWHFAYAKLLTISDLMTAISKYNASYDFDAACTWKGSGLPMLGWKNVDTMRMKRRFHKEANRWVIEFAEYPINVDSESKEYWRYAYKSPLYDHIKCEWNEKYDTTSGSMDEGTSGAVEEENEVD